MPLIRLAYYTTGLLENIFYRESSWHLAAVVNNSPFHQRRPFHLSARILLLRTAFAFNLSGIKLPSSPIRGEKAVGATTSSMSVRKDVSSSMATPCSSEQFLFTDWSAPLVSMDQNVDFNSSIVLEQFQRPSTFVDERSIVPDIQFANKHGIERSIKGKKRKSNLEDEQQRNVSPESAKSPTTEKDEGKQASESPGSGAQNPTQDGEACKEDYIHVRAKRGQATNSHSLAERVRREKISERMRLLQDLVPGCNKITGKAMMLDEIINYVQSLQRQVEFLSMKLAAVNPELHFDVDQILSKDILHSRDGGLGAFELAQGMSAFQPHFHGSSPQGIMQSAMAMSNVHNSGDMMRSTIHLGSPMAQLPSVWDDELQTVLQMGFIPNQHLVGSDLNGSMKMEL